MVRVSVVVPLLREEVAGWLPRVVASLARMCAARPQQAEVLYCVADGGDRTPQLLTELLSSVMPQCTVSRHMWCFSRNELLLHNNADLSLLSLSKRPLSLSLSLSL